MTLKCRMSATFLCVMALGCGKKSDGDKAEVTGPVGLLNTADIATFKDQSRKVLSFLDQGQTGLTAVKAFVSGSSLPLSEPLAKPSADCSGMSDLFNFEFQPKQTSPGALSLANGDSCEIVERELHSFYSSAARSLAMQIKALAILDDTQLESCGIKAARLDTSATEAANAWRFFPSDGDNVKLDVYGAVNGNQVGYLAQFDATADTQASDHHALAHTNATLRSRGDTDEGTLTFDLNVTADSTVTYKDGADKTSFDATSSSKVSGLKVEGNSVVDEMVTIHSKSDGRFHKGEFTGKYSLAVNRIDSSTLRVTGQYASQSQDSSESSSFTMMLTKTPLGACVVKDYKQKIN